MCAADREVTVDVPDGLEWVEELGMSVKSRAAPRWAIWALAVPVVAMVYLAVASRRALSVGRGVLVGLLGVTVIGSVYAEVAAKAAVTPARRQPLPLTIAIALALVVMGTGLPSAPVRAASSDADAVIAVALNHLGAPYVWGAEGPRVFDCSGLVYFSFNKGGQLPLIGGRRLTAAGYYSYFATRGMTSKTNGHRGDLVIYGRGSHIGIYLGNGKVVSALTQGVTVHGLYALRSSFTTFLNVPWGKAVDSTPTTTTTFVSKVPAAPPDETADGGDDGDSNSDGTTTDQPSSDVVATGLAVGSMNVRQNAGSVETIISWVSRGQTVDVIGSTHTSGGALWYQVRKPSGKEGWVWSHWLQLTSGSVGGG